MVQKISDGNGGYIRSISLSSHIAIVGAVTSTALLIIGLLLGALRERNAIGNMLEGLATDEELATMAAGLKQGIDALDSRIEEHKDKNWHDPVGIELRGITEKIRSMEREQGHIQDEIDRNHP